jgi:hypothetical protein
VRPTDRCVYSRPVALKSGLMNMYAFPIFPDYLAIGVAILLIAWAGLRLYLRGKL